MLNDGRELQSKAKEAQTTPLWWRRIHGVAGNGEREQSLLKSTPWQASNYRAYALTAKDPGEQALIYGSGLCVTQKKPWWISFDLWVRLKNGFLKSHQQFQWLCQPCTSNILAENAFICGSGPCPCPVFEKPWWISLDLWVSLKNGYLNAINHSNDCIWNLNSGYFS